MVVKTWCRKEEEVGKKNSLTEERVLAIIVVVWGVGKLLKM